MSTFTILSFSAVYFLFKLVFLLCSLFPSQWFTAVWYPICWFSSTKLYFLFTPCCYLFLLTVSVLRGFEGLHSACALQKNKNNFSKELYTNILQPPATLLFLCFLPQWIISLLCTSIILTNPNPSQSAVYPKCFAHLSTPPPTGFYRSLES